MALSPGIFTATVFRTSLGRSQSGKPCVTVEFEIDGERMPAQIWLTPKGAETARRSLAALGFDCKKQSIGILDANPELLAGHEVEVELAEEEYKGNFTLKVKWINPLKSKVDSADEVKALDALLRGSKPALAPRPGPKAEAEENLDIPDDEIPF